MTDAAARGPVRIGVDLGGTKIEIVALDAAGDILLRERVPTPAGDYDATLAAVAGLVTAAEARLRVRATVGVGTPGALSRVTGRLKNSNSTVLNGRALLEDLQIALGRAVRIENDANCFAISEASDGAGQGAAVVFGVILGTGVGGGLVVQGRLVRGAGAIAGEWGHNPMPSPGQLGIASADDRARLLAEQPGPACYCGRFGCIETWLSGPGFARDHARSLPGAQRRHGAAMADAAAIMELAQGADPVAAASYRRYVDRCARALAAVINIVDPDVIVLGGGMSRISTLARDIESALPPYVFSDEVAVSVRNNRHGDSSGVRGAAWLWQAYA